MTKNKLTKAQKNRFNEKFGEDGKLIYDNPFARPIEVDEELKQHLADEIAIERKKIIENCRNKFVEIAILGNKDVAELKGLLLYTRFLEHLASFKNHAKT